MSTMQLKSTAERDNRRNHQVYTSSPVKQENHKSNDHGSGSCSFFFLIIPHMIIVQYFSIIRIFVSLSMKLTSNNFFFSQKCMK